MRITAIRARTYAYRLTRRIGDAQIPEGTDHGSETAVFVDTDEGVIGVAVGMGHGSAEIALLEPMLVGEDPRAVRGLWEHMVGSVFKLGLAGPTKYAIASVDCALWDLKAKAAGVPLWKELGARNGVVRAYASGLDMPLSDGELSEFYRGMAARGVHAGKLKVGRNLEDDLRRLQIMSEALASGGKTPVLMIDSNEYWAPKQAIRRIRRIEESFDLVWAEEPAGRRDIVGLRKVSESISAAVATGENLNTSEEFAELIRGDAVDMVQISVGLGGITGALQVAELAYSNNLPVTMGNCPGRHMAHLAAALPHHTMMEVLDAGRDQAFRHQSRLADGNIILGESPGSGIEFSEETLQRLDGDGGQRRSIADVYRRAAGTWVDE